MSTVQNNFKQSRFDIYDGGNAVGFLQYDMRDGQIWLTHTEFGPRFQERSFPENLIRDVLDDMHRRRLEVLPFCPLVRDFIANHTEYLSVVPAEQLHRFGFTARPQLVS